MTEKGLASETAERTHLGMRMIRALLLVHLLLVSPAVLHGEDSCETALTKAGASEPALRAVAERLSATRHFDCAAEALMRAVTLKPRDADLQYLLGTNLYSAGRTEKAQLVLEQASTLDDASPNIHLALGGVYHDLGETPAALRQWERALELDPGSTKALDWIAKGRIEAGQYMAAIDLLKTAPTDESLELDLVVAYGRAGLQEEAIAEARRALAVHPEYWKVESALAVLYVQRNRFQEALAVLAELLKRNPADEDAQLQTLRVLILSGDLQAASPAAERFARNHPHSFDALYPLGLIHREGGEYELALAELKEAAQIDPKSYDVRLNLGMTLVKLHRFGEARTELQEALELNSQAPEAHFQMAAAERGLGHPEEAHKESLLFQQRIRQRAAHDQQIELSAQAAQKLQDGDAAGAAIIYRQMSAADPENGLTFYNLALALDRAADQAGEQHALESAVRLKPDLAVAQNQLGYLQASAGRNSDAEASFRKAIAVAPQYAEAESNLGSLLASEGKFAEAEHLLRDAVAANPRYEDAWINLGATLAEQSRFDEARSAALSALRVDPENHSARELLAALPAPRTGLP